MVNKGDVWGAGVAGILAGGILFGTIVGINSVKQGATLQEYQLGNHKIIRMYNPLRGDKVFVENPGAEGQYLTLSEYLARIENGYDRKIEKAQIEKLVDWWTSNI